MPLTQQPWCESPTGVFRQDDLVVEELNFYYFYHPLPPPQFPSIEVQASRFKSSFVSFEAASMAINFVGPTPLHLHSTYSSTRRRRYRSQVPKCALAPAVVIAPHVARVAAASMIGASFALKAKGAIVYGKLLGAGALCACGLAVFTSSSSSRSGSGNGNGGGGTTTTTSRFASSRALWDEENSEVASAQKPGAATSGGLYTTALGAMRTLVFSVLLPALDALRVLVSDLRSYGPGPPGRGSAGYFQRVDSEVAARRVHSVHTGRVPRTAEERQLEALGETARVLGTAANRGAKRARNALQSLLDGFR